MEQKQDGAGQGERPRGSGRALAGIAEFLLARIADDEKNCGAYLTIYPGDTHPVSVLFRRVMDECAAKRAILGMHRNMPSPFIDGLCTTCAETGPGAQAFPCGTVKAIAAVYSDHADYRQEWAA